MPISCRRRETALCHSVMNTEHEDNIWRERRSVLGSAARGFRNRCPNCGKGKLLPVYLRPHDICSFCREPNGLIMAHDAPPYITILIVGHIIAAKFLELSLRRYAAARQGRLDRFDVGVAAERQRSSIIDFSKSGQQMRKVRSRGRSPSRASNVSANSALR